MKHYSSAAIAAAAIAAMSSAVSAADLSYKAPPAAPVIATYSWTGLYLDGFLGGAVNSTNESVAGNGFAATISGVPKGVVGGAEIGYDFQLSPQFVWGLFLEGALANINGGGNLTAAQFPVTVNNSTNYLVGAGGRLGWLVNNSTLLYAKGGFGAGGAHPDFTATVTQSIRDTSTGWLAGAGIEERLTQNWFVRLEYEHYQLGDKTLTINLGGANVMTNTAKYDIDLAKGVLGYRF